MHGRHTKLRLQQELLLQEVQLPALELQLQHRLC